jgi:hypothetical protein
MPEESDAAIRVADLRTRAPDLRERSRDEAEHRLRSAEALLVERRIVHEHEAALLRNGL